VTLVEALPTFNACMNATSATALFAGFWAIRNKRMDVHWKLMATAFCASGLFLAGYLTRMALVRHLHPYEGPLRPLYLTLLVSHSILAALALPLILRTMWLSAVKKRYADHRKIARWTFPVWAYVSVTGVVVYLMLYRFAPAAAQHISVSTLP
jgi:putative membrane protein